jgi:hypothetical protein
MLDSLVRVSRRACGKDFVPVKGNKARSMQRRARKGITKPKLRYLPLGRLPRRESTGTSTERTGCAPQRGAQKMPTSNTPCNSFPFSDFRHSLTLFSKFFASFPHGTCSLSVSRQYLALEGIYLPLRAAVPSNSTLRKNGVRAVHEATNGTVTLHGSLFQGNWTSPTLPRLLETTIRALLPDFQIELFPLHSPLLGESWLVSFPPLNYMLKFSGSSFLT